jgi:hypothetical protein
MGAMRCQLKTQMDIEVVGALTDLVEEDKRPGDTVRGLSTVTAACLVRTECVRECERERCTDTHRQVQTGADTEVGGGTEGQALARGAAVCTCRRTHTWRGD